VNLSTYPKYTYYFVLEVSIHCTHSVHKQPKVHVLSYKKGKSNGIRVCTITEITRIKYQYQPAIQFIFSRVPGRDSVVEVEDEHEEWNEGLILGYR